MVSQDKFSSHSPLSLLGRMKKTETDGVARCFLKSYVATFNYNLADYNNYDDSYEKVSMMIPMKPLFMMFSMKSSFHDVSYEILRMGQIQSHTIRPGSL